MIATPHIEVLLGAVPVPAHLVPRQGPIYPSLPERWTLTEYAKAKGTIHSEVVREVCRAIDEGDVVVVGQLKTLKGKSMRVYSFTEAATTKRQS